MLQTTDSTNHAINVVRINEILPHNNADNLSIIKVDGYQCVVVKDQFKLGQLAYYVPPDSVVPVRPEFAFLWEGKANEDGTVPEKDPRITVRKFRKEWSEGLLMPLSDAFCDHTSVSYEHADSCPDHILKVREGDDVSELLGITHYNPPEPDTYDSDSEAGPGRKKKYPRSLRGWFYWFMQKLGFNFNGQFGGTTEQGPFNVPEYDVSAFKHYPHTFAEYELVIVTEKIHGSNIRAVFYDGHFFVGSHRQWKKEGSNCVFRKATKANPWIEEWCRAHEGYAIYGEVTPTQKLSDGKPFDYGSPEYQVFVYDIRKPGGTWADVKEAFELMGGSVFMSDSGAPLRLFPPTHWVPLFYVGAYHDEIKNVYVDGISLAINAKHIREGNVTRSFYERRSHELAMHRPQVKLVSNAYYEKTGQK